MYSDVTDMTTLNIGEITPVAYFWIYYVMNTVVGPGRFICRSQLNLHPRVLDICCIISFFSSSSSFFFFFLYFIWLVG